MAKVSHHRGVFERDKGSGVWWIHYQINGRRRREKIGRYNDACLAYAKRKTESLRQRALPELYPQAAPATFGDLVEKARQHSQMYFPKSYQEQLYKYRRVLAHFGAQTPAARIDKPAIEAFLHQIAHEGELTRSTVNRYRSNLSLIFHLAEEAGTMPSNPVKRIRRFPENNSRDRWLTMEEEERLYEVMAQHYPHRIPEIIIAVHTGLRQGSQYGLEWSDVDLANRVIRLRDPKAGEKQFVRLNDAALAAFQSLLAGPVAELRRALKRRIGRPAQFPVGDNRVFDRRTPRDWFERVVKLARLENFRWHDLRHTVGSRAVMQGVPLRAVQELLGHKSIKTTEKYAHLAPDFQQAAVDSLMAWLPSKPRAQGGRVTPITSALLFRSGKSKKTGG